jgi:glycosyl transferase family 2
MAKRNSTPSRLLPASIRRLRGHLREMRRIASETQQQTSEIAAAVERLEGRMSDLLARQAADHAQLLEALRFVHSPSDSMRERLRQLRAAPDYDRPFTETNPLVSVVIPTYDNHELLRERSLPSVLAQTYQNFEVLVVGDAAPDAARTAVESLNDPRIRFSNLPYRGPYSDVPEIRWRVAGVPPYNAGVRGAKGLWIAPLADDDAFRPQHIERVLRCALDERLEFAYGQLCMHSEDGTTETIGRFPPEHEQFGLQSALYHHGIARAFELELADAALGLPSDWGLCLRMMIAGVRIGMLDEVTADYYPSRQWTPRWEE